MNYLSHLKSFLVGLWLSFLLLMSLSSTSVRLIAQTTNASQDGQARSKLTIRARSSSVKAGSPVWIDAELENVSDHTISIYKAISEDMDQGGWVYEVQVGNENGVSPNKTAYARSIGAGGSGGYVPLEAGKRITESINVSKLYDLTRPGKYRIHLRRFDKEAKIFIISNSVIITVTP